MRIEQVEPCSHGSRGQLCWYSYDGKPCPNRRVLDGFPPEAIEAARDAVLNLRLSVATSDEIVQTILDAAWRVLTGDEQ